MRPSIMTFTYISTMTSPTTLLLEIYPLTPLRIFYYDVTNSTDYCDIINSIINDANIVSSTITSLNLYYDVLL